MKKILFPVSFVVAACCMFAGCSQKEEGGPAKENSTSTQMSSGGSSSSGGEAVELKLKWTAGKKYIQHMTMAQDSEAKMGQRSMQQHMEMTSDYSVSALKSLPDGGTDLELEFTAQKMEVDAGGQTLHFDSASDPTEDAGNPLAATLRKMVGAKIHYLTDANGKVQKVEGFNEFLDRLGASSPQAAMMKSMFNEDTLKQYADFGRGLPDHPVKPGDTWPLKLQMPVGPVGELTLNLNYTFKGMEQHDGHNCALLDYTGTLSSTPLENTNGMALNIENGKISGTTWFDPDLGMVIETASDQSMDIKIGGSTGQTITSSVTQKTGLKLSEVTDIK